MSFMQPSGASFSAVAGGYVGLLAMGGTGLVLGTDYLTPWPVAIGVCIGLAVAVRCYTGTAPATALVRTRVSLLPLILPAIPVFVAPFFPVLGLRSYETVVASRLLEWLVVVLAGGLLYSITVNRHVAALHERESVLAQWRARPDFRYRWLVRLVGFGVGCSCIVGGFVVIHTVDPAVNPLPAFGGAVIGQALAAGRYRTYTLFESGLCIRRSKTVNHQFVPRAQLRSVDLSGDRLTVRRGFPWPFPVRCSTATITRPQRVANTLERLLEVNQAVTWRN